MNLRQTSLVLCLLISVSSIKLFGIVPPPKKSGVNKTVITEIDKFVTQLHNQLTAIEGTLRSLNITIIKEKAFNKIRRKNIQAFISQLMARIDSIKRENFRNADLEGCQVLADFNHQIVLLVEKLRTNKFRGIKSFNVDTFLKTLHRKKNISGADILKKFQATWKLLATIEKEGLGLSRLNRITRWIDDKIIAPSQRYSLTSRSIELVAIPLLAYYFWYHVTHLSPNMKGYVNLEDNWIAKVIGIDTVFSEVVRHRSPILEHGGGVVLHALLKEYYQHLKPYLDKKVKVWLNEAKGGSYIKEAQRIDEKIEKVRFKDIYGHDEITRYFKFLVNYLEDSETHDRQEVRPSRGILCIGDTRTGKTFCINAFLEEVNQMLISTNQIGKFRLIKPSVLKIKIDGMEKILREAKAKAPCILFIDEIDLLDLQRTGENRTLSEFLTAMSDAINSHDSRRQIFIIAATNCPETLDKALRQPGRFGKELRFEYPNFTDRLHFIKSKVFEFIFPDQEKFFNIEKLANYTNNQSYEAMNLFIKDAMMKAKIDNNGELTQQYLESALEEDVFHIIPAHSKDIPVHEKQILAAHFAGQALALSLLESNLKLAKVTIKQVMTELEEKVMGSHLYDNANKEQQRFEYGKLFTFHEQDSINMQTQKEKLNLIKLHIAGFVAEELLLGSCGYSCHAEEDHVLALSVAKSLTFQGIDEATLPKHIVRTYYDEAVALKDTCTKEVKELLSKHQNILSQISQELLKEQTLDYQHIETIRAAAAA